MRFVGNIIVIALYLWCIAWGLMGVVYCLQGKVVIGLNL